MISGESRRLAGVLLVVFPTVIFGGASLLRLLVTQEPGYVDNPIRQDLFRAGHAHAGVILILSLVALRYVDEATLGEGTRKLVRFAIPSAAIFLPIAFFFSVLSPSATAPNAVVYLAVIGAVVLATALLTLGVGLIRRPRDTGGH
jgi:hypothetical protein